MGIRPLFDRVLVKRKDAVEASKGGLFLPESARKKSHLADVVAVGHGRLAKDGALLDLAVEVGQTVMLAEWGGDEVKLDGQEHLFVRESDILGVLT